jgi:glutathione peroxidase
MAFLRFISTFISSLVMGFGLSHAAEKVEKKAHDFTLLSLDGELLPLKQLQGKVVLVVNTASHCGLTPQYAGLEALWQEYKDRGLVVLGVPSNDFGEQEPGTPEEIRNFTAEQYHVTFPLTQKEKVVGTGAHPFFVWAAAKAGPLGTPKWNFHKFLIGKDGEFIDWFASSTAPSNEKLRAAIEAALAK